MPISTCSLMSDNIRRACRPACAGSAAPARARRCNRAPIASACWRVRSPCPCSGPSRSMMSCLSPSLFDRDLKRALSFGDRHREELALLAGDEQAVDAQIVDPVAQIAAEPGLVDRQDPPRTASGPRPRCPSCGRGRSPWPPNGGISWRFLSIPVGCIMPQNSGGAYRQFRSAAMPPAQFRNEAQKLGT